MAPCRRGDLRRRDPDHRGEHDLVSALLASVVGVQLGIEGLQGLNIIGLTPLTGLLSAFANTRELSPLLAGYGLAAQMGCKFTAQLGAMKVNEEIDALEVMSIPSLPYLVTTRLLAALAAVIPLYLLALSGAYLATQFAVLTIAHQGSGTYLHYFYLFLNRRDVFYSVLKVVVFALLVTIIHCYYGMTASGGPEGVGRATGRAIRMSTVAIAIIRHVDDPALLGHHGPGEGDRVTVAAPRCPGPAAGRQPGHGATGTAGLVLAAAGARWPAGGPARRRGGRGPRVLRRRLLHLRGGPGRSYRPPRPRWPSAPRSSTATSRWAPWPARAGRSPAALCLVTLHIDRSMLHVIPAGVHATETPVSFFGDAYIVLVAPAHPGTAQAPPRRHHPRPGRWARPRRCRPPWAISTRCSVKLHPGELDAALTALASSLQGNGTSLGHNLVRANTYFQQMLPLWPTVVSNLNTLVPVANQFAASTPDLLQILANQTTTATTINDRGHRGAPGHRGWGDAHRPSRPSCSTAIQQPYAILAADSGPFLKAISQNPEEISQLLQGLDDWAMAWTRGRVLGAVSRPDREPGRRQPG